MPTIDLHCNPNLYSDWKVKESSKLKHYDISSDDYGHPLTPARQRTLQQHINDYLNAYQTGCRIYDQTGGIYQQKTGKDLLYLGHIQSTVYAKYQHSTEDYEPLGKPHETFAYLKINQTVENALASSHNIQEFFDAYSQACLAKHQELTSNISRCKHPKKLTAYLRQSFPIPNTTTVNFPVWDNISKTVTLVQATLKQI